MRARRLQLGLTGSEVAARAGISSSYVSLIENGFKVPDEDVAAALARALEDDEDLYRAWARAVRLGLDKLDLVNRLEVMSRTPAYVKQVEMGEADLHSRLREVAWRIAPGLLGPSASPPAPEATPAPSPRPASVPGAVRVAILPPGTAPERAQDVAGDSLLLDERLLEGCDPKRLFACVVAERDLEHLRGLAEPGDHVVFDRDGAAGPGRIAAVRTPEGLRLARVLHRGPTLLLLPGEGGDAFRTVTLPDPQDPSSALAGAHRLLIRR